MDSGLGSDDDRRTRTKEQKQRLNQQLLSGCFIDAASLADEENDLNEHRRNDERRQGALIFQTSIPQFSMLQMSEAASNYPPMSASCTSLPILPSEPDTPFNSMVQLEEDRPESTSYKTPLGFYVDLNEVEDMSNSTPSTSTKKNIFSMVIDFEAPKKDKPMRLSSSMISRRKPTNERAAQPMKGVIKSSVENGCLSSSSPSNRSYNGNCSDYNEAKLDIKISLNGEKVVSQSSSCSERSLECGGEQLVILKSEVEVEEKLLEAREVEQKNENELNESFVETKSNTSEDTFSISQRRENSEQTDKEEVVETLETGKPNNNNVQQFVKLSDLERQAPRVDFSLAPKMSRSIPESSWVESPLLMSRSAGYRSAPHPIEPESSELSDSLTDTSMSQPRKSAQRLGTDLLRMFLEEIGPDVTVEVESHRFKAHKCILASRCQYFAAMLSGNWLENSGNVISLQGFSYESVYFALCHIYSGAAHVPDSISLVELASLADMLGLEGLKEVVEHALKQRHCHNFHRPCAGCSTGVVEVLPLAAACGLDNLYQKCLQWVTQHFAKVWPSRAFALLPKELRDKCYQQHIVHMTPDTVLETTLSCDKLLASVPTLRWAEPVLQLGLQLADACQLYTKQHFTAVLGCPKFLELDAGINWNANQIEEYLMAAASKLGPEQSCRGYSKVNKMLEQSWSSRFMQFILRLKGQVEKTLVGQADRASRCPGWVRMDPILRTRIKEMSCLPLDDPPHTRLPRAISARLKKYSQPNVTKQAKGNAISSSDSSRNSSPGINQVQSRVLNNAGSPSLRRSLLLAARAPQVPPSPTVHRRSTLTQPTQSSAAKSAPSRNIKTNSQKSTAKPAPKMPLTTTNKNVKNISKDSQSQVYKKTVASNNVKRGPSGAGKKPAVGSRGSSPKPPAVAKSNSGSSITSSPKKSPKKIAETATAMRRIHRSDTFLKEEPTVLKKP